MERALVVAPREILEEEEMGCVAGCGETVGSVATERPHAQGVISESREALVARRALGASPALVEA